MKTTGIFFAALFTAATTLAQNWTGAVDSDWNNPANWTAAPGNGDNIVIDPSNYAGAMAQPVVSVNSNFIPGEMLLQNGAQLTIAAELSASDRVEALGTGTLIALTGGTFALTGGGNNARLVIAENAHLQMNGGNLLIGQRLLFELGGSGEINAGNVTVQETLALVDGSAAAPSRLVQNGGTITANGEFGFENEAGNFFPVFEQAGGTLNINGTLVWLGAAPGSGRGYLRSTGGTIHVTGTILNDPASTMGMEIALSGTALLENAGTAVALLAGDSVSIAGNAHWHDLNAVAWQNDGVFHAQQGGLFTSGNTTLNGSGSWQFAALAVPASKLLNHVSPAAISVSGNMTVSGNFSHAANKLILNGTAQQTVTAVSGLNVYDLEANNSAAGTAIVLNDDLHAAHDLHLAAGIIGTAPAAAINLADDATITGGSETAFVDGYILKTGDDALLFPLGESPDRYRPLSITAPATATTVVRAGYRFEPYAQLVPVGTPLQSVSAIEHWDLSRTGSADLFTATVGWNNASESGLTDCASIALGVWNGTEWTFVPATASGLCAGASEGSLAGSAELPVIGPLTIGFTENVYQNSVQLCPGDSITVGSHTYTASGVYTDVLQDVNGGDSTIVTVLTVLAPLAVTVTDNITHITASSANATAFQWIDCGNDNMPVAGETAPEFYPSANGSYAVVVTRDSCTDSDTSVCVVIDQLGTEEMHQPVMTVYPNPLKHGEKLTITAPDKITGVAIRTTDGRLAATIGTSDLQQGTTVSVDLPDLPGGVYLLVATTSGGSAMHARIAVTH